MTKCTLIYLFACLMSLSIAGTIQDPMMGLIMNNELERMWKEVVSG
jgi:hypothetical protein